MMILGRITSFTGHYAFLSNFYRNPFDYHSVRWTSAEHAFQSQKTMTEEDYWSIYYASTPSEAKRLGRRITLRPDWDVIKIGVMLEVLRAKFAPGTPLAELLLSTGDAHLEEGNTWGDRDWGTVNGMGNNHLGLCLMRVRGELQDQ